MKIAVFFQKHEHRKLIGLVKKIYLKFFLRSTKRKVQYLRDAGAKIGKNVNIPSVTMLGTEPCLVEIGDNVFFSGCDIGIITHDGSIGRLYYMGLTPKMYDVFGKVKIGSNCFISHNVTILRNVEIGDNCIIGAGSIVTRSIPAGSVAVGVPARVICTVEEFYEKHKDEFCDTVRWNAWKKRQFLEQKFGL